MHYDRPVRELLRECAQELQPPFGRAEILEWFRTRYPSIQPSTVSVHIAGMTERSGNDGHLSAYPPVLRRVARGLYVPAGSTSVEAASAAASSRSAAVTST